jgi:hypothetical protein
VYVWGKLLLYYEEGNPRKRVAPDIFVALDVPKKAPRDYYLDWKEGKAPDFIVEITSKSTKREDLKKKWVVYRDILKVSEYFLFDPKAEYLDPPLQGYRLVAGDYVPVGPIAGRLPSAVLGLHQERDGVTLRFVDPATGRRLPTRREACDEATERRRAAEEYSRAAQERRRAEAAQRRDREEIDRLRQEIEAFRRG